MFLGQRLQEPSPGGEGLAASVAGAEIVGIDADQGPQMPFEPRDLRRLRDDRRDGAVDLARRPSSSSESSTPVKPRTISQNGQNVAPSPYGRERPSSQPQSPWRSSSRASSDTSRVLPIPGTPMRVRSCGSRSRWTRSTVPRSNVSSRSRPTSGVSLARRPATGVRGRTASHTRIGSLLPFATTGGASSNSIDRPVARRVASSTKMLPAGAADSRRAAVLTLSPEAVCSPCSILASSVISASPVVMPMWTSRSPPAASSSRIASAALTARSGSSSCATGAPKIAITASPTNFATVPPCRSRTERSWAWYGCRSRCTSSGSIRSERAVNPTRSANSTVTTLRSSRRGRASPSSGEPHALQNRAPVGLSCRQT